MRLVADAASWEQAADGRPCPVRHQPQPSTASVPSPAGPPRHAVLTLSPAQAQRVGPAVPQLVEELDPRTGDRVTVDLAAAACADLTGLALLLSTLWRRAGPDGDVALAGGTPALRAQLTSLGVTPAACRASVYGAGRASARVQTWPARAVPPPHPGGERCAGRTGTGTHVW